MLTWLLSWLSGGVLDRLLTFFEQKQLSEVERDKVAATVAVESIKAEIETRKLQKELIASESGWWVTAWIRPIIIYPLAFHLNAVILDSVFHLGWNIAKLPSPMDQWQGSIILSYFLARPVEKIGRSVVAYFRGRSTL